MQIPATRSKVQEESKAEVLNDEMQVSLSELTKVAKLFSKQKCHVTGRHYHRTRDTPGAPAVQSFLTRKSSGQEPILRNPGDGRKKRDSSLRPGEAGGGAGEERNDEGEEHTSGAEKEAVTDPRTAREQEDIGTTSGDPREVRTRRQYPKTPASADEAFQTSADLYPGKETCLKGKKKSLKGNTKKMQRCAALRY
ncbi:hypothetical protein NDU88_000018 [Pleurodeles waltl]|uniref:Uncharacterized protein n=1 Tax=Pleurodeles waltl TaxID=8319 RepID=A0AAV7VWB9_PLEWA|nr:hypothetical protein NDU88_000018 [Pleurodeles waltl]